MHNDFYASGFIYHLPSQQILLQQRHPSTTTAFPWGLFENELPADMQPETVFKNTLQHLLGITVDAIYPIYSYFNEETKKNYSLLYATIEKLQEFPQKEEISFRWFPFKDVLKLQAEAQIKHDIVVGQRVIEAARRKANGEHTFQ